MLKKVSVLFVCALLSGCSVFHKGLDYDPYKYYTVDKKAVDMTDMTNYAQVDLGNASSFRVAMLLPLSGSAGSTGQSMKNAAMMAIGDINNNNLVVQFYDTKSTGSGARVAFENALNTDNDLILGPLLSEEVAAIATEAKNKNIPVISFSTSPSVLQSGIYSLGLLNENQINRIIKYAADQGRTRVAAVLPNNQSGENMYHSLLKSAQNSGVQIVKVGFYEAGSMDFTALVTQMKEGGVDFDALLIPETGNRLKAISSMFSYYDVAAPEVLFMGTSVWDNSDLSKETELYGATYPAISLKNQNRFTEKYKELFGAHPTGLSIFAYDAVALASMVARQGGNIYEQILRPEGYAGISGSFRIFADGTNEHSMDILKVSSGGKYVAEYAPAQFYGYPTQADASVATYTQTPQIYGKNAAQLQNSASAVY